MHSIAFHQDEEPVTWIGLSIVDNDVFGAFLKAEVAARLQDEDGTADFTHHLSSLASTGFAQDSLQAILGARQGEERAWAIGEALAEAWLTKEHNVIWPWNMERDKRTPRASLPGADLVGFQIDGGKTRLVLGEVKSSSEISTPPNVMTGRKGMTQQLENLVSDLGLLHTLLRWLQPRCKGSNAEPHFNAAIKSLLESGNREMVLFGVLVRDTAPHELDLKKRGVHLGTLVKAPAVCKLLALYIPYSINSLPKQILSGAQS
ncbi:hypothetical protein [Pseudomonas viridiflava]|uniref:hypothetical protein n=1 Tax=Pseudomonas viridiflava TaxID=33069 RepID=UPI001981CFD9|nr:hypothetical protein [Pseudomonas viridiflava]